jgi:hypothetical protein
MKDVNLDSLLKQYINNTLHNTYTAIPCKVTATESLAEQRISVQPIINKITPSGEEQIQPILQSVPVVFPGSSTSQFSFPVSIGDTVLCVFSQRSLDRFKLGGNDLHRPLNFRKFSRNDAIAIPGLFPFQSAANNPSNRSLEHSVEDAVVTHNIGGNECEVRLKASGEVIVNAATKVTVNAAQETVINAEKVVINCDVEVNGKVEATNDVVGNGISLTHHTHGGVDTGPGSTQPPN